MIQKNNKNLILFKKKEKSFRKHSDLVLILKSHNIWQRIIFKKHIKEYRISEQLIHNFKQNAQTGKYWFVL